MIDVPETNRQKAERLVANAMAGPMAYDYFWGSAEESQRPTDVDRASLLTTAQQALAAHFEPVMKHWELPGYDAPDAALTRVMDLWAKPEELVALIEHSLTMASKLPNPAPRRVDPAERARQIVSAAGRQR